MFFRDIAEEFRIGVKHYNCHISIFYPSLIYFVNFLTTCVFNKNQDFLSSNICY